MRASRRLADAQRLEARGFDSRRLHIQKPSNLSGLLGLFFVHGAAGNELGARARARSRAGVSGHLGVEAQVRAARVAASTHMRVIIPQVTTSVAPLSRSHCCSGVSLKALA